MWREAGRRGDRDSLLYRGRAQRGTETVFYTHGALYKQRSRVTGRRLGLRPQGRASQRAARTRTQYTSSAVRGRGAAPGSSGFVPRRSLTGWTRRHPTDPSQILRCHPPPGPFVVYRACRRVEVGRDRHAQKASCGGRAVAIDSAAVTRVHIPMRELRMCPSFSIALLSHCCLGRGCSRDRLYTY